MAKEQSLTVMVRFKASLELKEGKALEAAVFILPMERSAYSPVLKSDNKMWKGFVNTRIMS